MRFLLLARPSGWVPMCIGRPTAPSTTNSNSNSAIATATATAEPSRKVKLFNRNDDNLVNCLCDLVTGQNLCGKNKKKEKWTLAQFETSLQGFTHEDYAWLVNRATNGIGVAQNQ